MNKLARKDMETIFQICQNACFGRENAKRRNQRNNKTICECVNRLDGYCRLLCFVSCCIRSLIGKSFQNFSIRPLLFKSVAAVIVFVLFHFLGLSYWMCLPQNRNGNMCSRCCCCRQFNVQISRRKDVIAQELWTWFMQWQGIYRDCSSPPPRVRRRKKKHQIYIRSLESK